MTIQIKNTKEIQNAATLNVLVFGLPKVGKSTFAATAPKPLVIDLEGGYKHMGRRGINIDTVSISKFDELREVYDLVRKSDYQTIIIDPVNELVERLINEAKLNPAYVLRTNSEKLSMDGWVHIKDTMKKMIKTFRDLEKHVIFVAHLSEKEDEGQVMKRPKIDANLTDELCRHMDIILYMTAQGTGDSAKRHLMSKGTERVFAGDRTGALPELVEPDFMKILGYINGNPQASYKLKLEKENEKNQDAFEASLELQAPAPVKVTATQEPISAAKKKMLEGMSKVKPTPKTPQDEEAEAIDELAKALDGEIIH